MNYELAKELKDAGFPQELKMGDWFYPIHESTHLRLVTLHGSEHTERCGHGRCDCECNYCYPDACRDGLKVPTLEELIEACGEGFHKLSKTGVWSTYGARSNGAVEIEVGANPTEAVARLWLALNKKN